MGGLILCDIVTYMETPQKQFGITTRCPMCGESDVVPVRLADYILWKQGELAQVAMPYLTPAQREQLITGVCSPCWEAMWEDEDDEEI